LQRVMRRSNVRVEAWTVNDDLPNPADTPAASVPASHYVERAYDVDRSPPGCAVLTACAAVDAVLVFVLFVIFEAGGRIGREWDWVAAIPIGWFVAQGTMVAIWLALLAPGLYWGVFLAFTAPVVLAIFVNPPGSPWILMLAIMLYPLPFAFASLMGLKVLQVIASEEAEKSAQPIRFSIRSMLVWTFIIAAALGLVRLLPRPSGNYSEVWFWFVVAATGGLVTLLAVLKPGSNRFRWLIPIGVASILAILAGILFDQTFQETRTKLSVAILHVLFLVWLLSFYRRAGYRAVWRRGYYPEPVRRVTREPVNPLAD
jgi:hypothetical protein